MAAAASGERHLATRAKGIYKPDGWDYALSIKMLPGSPYNDGRPVPTPGGGWLLSYHQEGNDPGFFTNAGLKRRIQDRVPVGVLWKVDSRRRNVQYEVLGLPLRSDIHTLYDLDLIAIDPDTHEVVLSPRLYGTQYASLAGVKLLDPQQDSH